MKATNLTTASLTNVAQTAGVKTQNTVRTVEKDLGNTTESKDSFDDALQTAQTTQPQDAKTNEVKETATSPQEAKPQETPTEDKAGQAEAPPEGQAEPQEQAPEIKPQATNLDAMLLALAGNAQLQANDAPVQVTETLAEANENTPQLTLQGAEAMPQAQNLMPQLTNLESLLPSEANALNQETSLQSLVPQGGQQEQQGQQLMQLLTGNNVMSQTQLTNTGGQVEPMLATAEQNEVQMVIPDRQEAEQVLNMAAEAPQTTQVIAANAETLQALQQEVKTPADKTGQQDAKSILGDAVLTVEKQEEPLNQLQDLRSQLQQQNRQAPEQNTTGEVISQKVQIPGEAAFDSVSVNGDTNDAAPQSEQLAGASLQQPFMPQMQADSAAAPQAVEQQPQVDSNNVMQQIVQQARLVQTADGNEMVIRLEPEYLGELTMRIAVKGDGTVNATFLADTAQTRSILQSSLVELKQQLEAQGMKVDNVEVSAQLTQDFFANSEAGQQGYAYQQQSGSARNEAALRNAFANDAEATTEFIDTAAPAGAGINQATDDGVDYRI